MYCMLGVSHKPTIRAVGFLEMMSWSSCLKFNLRYTMLRIESNLASILIGSSPLFKASWILIKDIGKF